MRAGWVALLLPGCGGVVGDWRGTCAWDNGRSARVSLTLVAPEDGPVGTGAGRWNEDGREVVGDLAWQSDGEEVRIDLLPPRKGGGNPLFFRGTLRDDGRISGRCGDRRPEVLNLGGLFDCVASLGFDCGGVDDWEPTGESVAPVERDDLQGRLTLE